MKRLLLIAALVAPTWLYSCMPKSVVPDPTTVIKETFDNLPVPEVRDIPIIKVPAQDYSLPAPKPQAKKNDRHVPHSTPRPVPRPRPPVVLPRPPAREAPVETLPPQEGVICIFPFNMVPTCTPEPAGRQP